MICYYCFALPGHKSVFSLFGGRMRDMADLQALCKCVIYVKEEEVCFFHRTRAYECRELAGWHGRRRRRAGCGRACVCVHSPSLDVRWRVMRGLGFWRGLACVGVVFGVVRRQFQSLVSLISVVRACFLGGGVGAVVCLAPSQCGRRHIMLLTRFGRGRWDNVTRWDNRPAWWRCPDPAVARA